jgi:phage terminase large subunit-like protein
MKTNQLTGAALDWAVAICEGHKVNVGFRNLTYIPKGKRTLYNYSPSTNWAQGGPIIEIMGMGITRTNKTNEEPWAACVAQYPSADIYLHGATPLEAAMRCYVAYRLGDEVELPEELK